MFKIIIIKNDRDDIWRKYTLQFAICPKIMELFKLYSKEKAIFLCLSYFLLSWNVNSC